LWLSQKIAGGVKVSKLQYSNRLSSGVKVHSHFNFLQVAVGHDV